MSAVSDTFNKTVYEIIAMIPEGRVISYGLLALLAGKPGGARMAARAVSHAPLGVDLPFHRVVNQSGHLAPPEAFSGEGIQRAMLETEGVLFKSNGCVDMRKCTWTG